MEFIGLFVELLILAAAIYLYLFSIGRLKVKDLAAQKKAEQFRKANGSWLRIMALALMAIFSLNIFAHIGELLGLLN